MGKDIFENRFGKLLSFCTSMPLVTISSVLCPEWLVTFYATLGEYSVILEKILIGVESLPPRPRDNKHNGNSPIYLGLPLSPEWLWCRSLGHLS